jgi:hypothetical protein
MRHRHASGWQCGPVSSAVHAVSSFDGRPTNAEFASITFRQRMSKDISRLPPLDLLAAFEAVARLGSITRAAG